MAKRKIPTYVFNPGNGLLDNERPNATALLEANKEFIKDESVGYINGRITTDTAQNDYPFAYTLLNINKQFIVAEMKAWIQSQISTNQGNFIGITYDDAYWNTDLTNFLNALEYDVRYGGNYKTNAHMSNNWNDETSLHEPTFDVYNDVYVELEALITDFILINTIKNPVQQVGQVQATNSNNGEPAAQIKVGNILTSALAVVNNGLGSLPTATYGYAFADYTYNTYKCERDVGYVLDAYIKDLQYGGNKETFETAEKYWVQDVPQIDGPRTPEIETHNWIRDLINNNILPQVAHTTLQTPVVTQQSFDPQISTEAGTTDNLTALTLLLTNTIQNGTSNMGTKTNGLGTIRFQGRYNEEDILLITNVTKGHVVYSFSDPTKLAEVEFLKDSDNLNETDFPSFDQTADTITSLKLYYNTATHASTDRLQIFVEEKEQRVRPYDFGTDAIERNRVANAQSMLDADFEYGLQPTKWQAIGMARGYPSIYEIPGTEISVESVTTDASSGTQGIGSSLITVNTIVTHGLSQGGPFTIKGLGSSALGFGRAEGSFAVNQVVNDKQFNFYAKSKVGTTNGEVISTTYTQLRKAGYFTGAAIGDPEFTVASNGSSGTFAVNLDWPSESDTIGFSGDVPEIGAPLVDATGAIPTGAQVTAINGTGAGIEFTADTAQDIPSGVSEFDVTSASGILVGYGMDRGDGEGVTVTQVSGNTVTLSGPITSPIPGSNVEYTGVVGTLKTTSGGIDARFDVVRSAGSYTPTINNAGSGYDVNDSLQIAGNLLGGTSPTHDLFIRVTGVGASGDITSISSTGTAAPADGLFPNIAGQLQNGQGTGAAFDITYTNNVYSATTSQIALNGFPIDAEEPDGNGAILLITTGNNSYFATVQNGGLSYQQGDNIRILGSNLGGVDGTNDCIVTVASVDGVTGEILSVSVAGTAVDAQNNYASVTLNYSGGSGVDASFVVQTNGTSYSPQITNPGTGYSQNETFVVPGTDLGGSSPTNDCTITITSVDGSGGITGVSGAGLAVNEANYGAQTGNVIYGTGASFDISATGSSYSVTVVGGGQEYSQGDQLLLTGAQVGGSSPANDATITVLTVDGTGAVLTASIAGTAPDLRGANYTTTDEITITGDQVGGATPANDLIVTVSTVGSNGEITSVTVSGTAPDGFGNYIDPAYTTASGGADAAFIVSRTGTTYSPSVQNGGTAYNIGDTLTISGANLGGTSPTNDLTITVADIDLGTGEITQINHSGTAANVGEAIGISGTNVAGAGAVFTINLASQVYTVQSVDNGGLGYRQNDTIVVPGNEIGGVTPANDATITVSTVDSSGQILTATVSGTGGNGSGTYTNTNSTYSPLNGTAAAFDITRTVSAYSIEVDPGGTGTGYYPGNTIFISGESLGGASPTNDATIVVESIDSVGAILTATITGTVTAAAAINFYGTVTFTETTTAALPATTSIDFESLATIEVQFDNPHGLIPGGTFIVAVASDDGSNNHALAGGSFIATNVPEKNKLRYVARTAGTIDIATSITATIYTRPDSFFIHRPYDGGVQLGTGGPQHGAQAIRQSKNYIRYQSGKGIMYTTGALFAPSYDVLSIESTGTGVGDILTIETDDVDHGLQVGGTIKLIGVSTAGYDGTYRVSDIVSERKFRVVATTQLGSKIPILGFGCQISVLNWHGATVRAGAYDDQNGIFWEYDGRNISVVQRSSTFQIAGTLNVNPDENVISGTGTRFKDQLKAGDRIVIRGMTHVVAHVNSQTEMIVTPDYRGVSPAYNAKGCIVIDKKVKQDSFNLDRLDGTGQSGYDTDISKMQMIGIQYSWYGAGFIDFMLRGADGNFIFCHRMRNSNVNTEAFMRSGNLPVRYEVTNEGPPGKLAEHLDDVETTITLEDASFFPPDGGTLLIDNEIITFTGVSGNDLTGCTRGTTMTNFQAGAQRQYTAGPAVEHERRTGVVLISNTITPIISHWGSAFITDGGFDEDRGYIFSYAATNIEASTVRNTALMIRLAPSVSNAITGDLGDRELLNRAQLLLNGIEITSEPLAASDTGGIVVEGILNPQNYPENPADVGWTDLGGEAQGGQPSFAQIAPSGAIVWGDATPVTANLTTLSTAPSFNATLYYQAWNNTNVIYIATSSVPSGSSIQVGMTVEYNGPGTPSDYIRNNTTVTQVNTYGSYIRVQLSRRTKDRVNAGTSYTFGYPLGPENANYALVTALSWEASNATEGTNIDSTDTHFPAGTQVVSVQKITVDTTTFYRITYSQTGTGLTAGSTIVMSLTPPVYAQPGETIFKFIAVPGERSVIDLTSIKELTNTSLGGRGTFPNGPDVLALNVYKTSGNAIPSNVILKWGEAQA